MFDQVGKNYDITNTVLSFGQDRYWRKRTRRRLDLKPGDKVLDLAAGTGVSTEEFTKSGAYCVACDFSRGMLHAGLSRGLPMVCGDGTQLPFADNTFDAVTISFGLRNIVDPAAGLGLHPYLIGDPDSSDVEEWIYDEQRAAPLTGAAAMLADPEDPEAFDPAFTP